MPYTIGENPVSSYFQFLGGCPNLVTPKYVNTIILFHKEVPKYNKVFFPVFVLKLFLKNYNLHKITFLGN